MLRQARIGDRAIIGTSNSAHLACPQRTTGPAVNGSSNVLVNGRPAMRVGDLGNHKNCCDVSTWRALKGSTSVLINWRPAHRAQDLCTHSGTQGTTIDGSPNVIVGDRPVRQGAEPHKIEIQVVAHHSRVPLDNIAYEILNMSGEVIQIGKTDQDGWIRAAPIPEGQYSILLLNGWIMDTESVIVESHINE